MARWVGRTASRSSGLRREPRRRHRRTGRSRRCTAISPVEVVHRAVDVAVLVRLLRDRRPHEVNPSRREDVDGRLGVCRVRVHEIRSALLASRTADARCEGVATELDDDRVRPQFARISSHLLEEVADGGAAEGAGLHVGARGGEVPHEVPPRLPRQRVAVEKDDGSCPTGHLLQGRFAPDGEVSARTGSAWSLDRCTVVRGPAGFGLSRGRVDDQCGHRDEDDGRQQAWCEVSGRLLVRWSTCPFGLDAHG